MIKYFNTIAVAVIFAFLISPMSVQGDELKDLSDKVKELEHNQAELYHNLSEKKSLGGSQLSDKLSFGALVEVEAGYEDNDRDNHIGSDIVLATVELAFDAEVNDMVEGHVLLLWEEDEGPMAMDEGTITVKTPYGIDWTLGKMYIPFGAYNSHFISDPFTLELGETNKSTIMATLAVGAATISVGAFNGEKDETVNATNSTDNINNFYGAVDVELNDGAIVFGASYISDLYETDFDVADRDNANLSVSHLGSVKEEIAGISAYVVLALGDFSLEGEIVKSLDDIHKDDFIMNGGDIDEAAFGKSPEAFNVELAYGISEDLEVAFRFETSSHIYDLPEEQVGVALSYSLAENTSIGIEYLEGSYDSDGKTTPFYGNFGEERSLVTTQIAIEF